MIGNAWQARYRFFVEQPFVAGTSCSLAPIAHQLATVLRLAPGQSIVAINGDGREYLVELQVVTPRSASGQVVDDRPCAGDPTRILSLFQCSLKQDKFEWILQKGTELGVTRFVPVVSARSVVRPTAALRKKYGRWQAVIREAVEQCGRSRLPELADPIEWQELVVPAASCGFVAWEEAAGAQNLVAAVAALSLAGDKMQPAVALLVGPEGGLTAEEVAGAAASGWQVVSLGSRILRAETAALAAVSVVALGAPPAPSPSALHCVTAPAHV